MKGPHLIPAEVFVAFKPQMTAGVRVDHVIVPDEFLQHGRMLTCNSGNLSSAPTMIGKSLGFGWGFNARVAAIGIIPANLALTQD